MQTKSPIFIVGCPRSGTSLLRNLLRSHPGLALPDESHFIPVYYKRFGDPGNEFEAVRLARAILNEHWIRWWQVDMKSSQFRHCRKFSEVVDTLFGLYAAHEKKPRWGDKTPQYVEHIPLLAALFPEARILHIIRDGRDVALSWQKNWFGPKNQFMTAKLWKQYVTAGMSAGRKLSEERYLEIRYEQLVAEPFKTMKKVCDFIGETFHPSVLTPNISKKLTGQKKIFGKKKRNQLRWINSGNTHRWKTLMTRRDCRVFERFAGDLLEKLEYEIQGYPRREPFRFEEMCWTAHSFILSNAARLDLVHTYTNWLPGMLKRALFLVLARSANKRKSE